MAKKRLIKIIGEITLEAYKEFSEKMDELEAASGKKPIEIELASGGGDTYAGFAFYSRIRKSPCVVSIHAVGLVMSAATIILAAGTWRAMDKDAWFMIHDDEEQPEGRTTDILKSAIDHYEAVEAQWSEILARHSKVSDSEWRRMSKTTTYLTAEQCKIAGIIEDVLENK